eukprot:scaffold129713_cov20-Tisochrysis_lutea.AAC.1
MSTHPFAAAGIGAVTPPTSSICMLRWAYAISWSGTSSVTGVMGTHGQARGRRGVSARALQQHICNAPGTHNA